MSNFKGLKSHPIHDFKHKKTFHVKKQSLSFQNKLSKLWATHEMNFWERKVHGAFKSVSMRRPGRTRQGVIMLKSPISLKLGTNVRYQELTYVK